MTVASRTLHCWTDAFDATSTGGIGARRPDVRWLIGINTMPCLTA
jgi:hypothetical protein